MRRPINYLSNKHLLREIWKAKLSYCEIHDSSHTTPDYSVYSEGVAERRLLAAKGKFVRAAANVSGAAMKKPVKPPITDKMIADAAKLLGREFEPPVTPTLASITPDLIRTVAAERLETLRREYARERRKPVNDPKLDWSEFETHETDAITVRLLTDDHIRPSENGSSRSKLGHLESVTFDPFILYRVSIDGDGVRIVEVARSHWEGGSQNGWFNPHRGKVSNSLARSLMLLVDRYSKKPNFRSYSYLEEMKALALMTLSENALKFDEVTGDNPFAYLTTVTHNAFVRIINEEKKATMIRDDLLEKDGALPSYTRQLARMSFPQGAASECRSVK